MLLKKQYIIILLLVALAFVGSFWLIPGQQELALMQMKDKHFEAARSAYEKETVSSTTTLEVANNLSDLYLQKGDIKKAIETMEKFVAVNPNDLQARLKLGRLYQYDQRTDDYMENLEAINNLRPNSDNLSTLSDIYNNKGDYDKQEKALKDVIAYEKGKDPKHYYDLANIQASRHDYVGAVATLRDLQKADPEHFTFANEVLLVSLLFDNRKPEDATKAASEWLDKHDNADEASDIINMVHYKGNVTLAGSLMSRYSQEKIDSTPKLLETFILLKLSENKDDEVYKRLRALYDNKKLPSSLSGDLLLLTVERGDRKTTHDLMKNIPLNTLPEDQVLRLIEASIVQEDSALLGYVTESFRGEDAQKLYPVIAAALAVANQTGDAPALLTRLDTLGFSHEQTLAIATICAHFERGECARHLLNNLPDHNKLSDSEVATIGDIYLLMREVDKGYAYIHEALEARSSPIVERVAVRFSAARGKDSEVDAWVSKHPNETTPYLLGDLFFGAYDNSKFNTAAHIAKIYRDKYKNDTARSLLATAYVAGKQYEQAVKVLRENNARIRTDEDEDNYLTSLAKLAPKNKTYRDELVGYANTRLHSDSLPEKQRLEILHTLIDTNETDTAMPYLKAEAMTRGGEWTKLYAMLLDKKGRHDEADKFWLKAINDPATTQVEKEDIAYVLLEHGNKGVAEPIFNEQAAHADARSNAVSELLYIWGPKPAPIHLQWMERRYEASSDTERKHWAAIIGDASSPDYIQGFVSRHPDTIQVPQVATTYFAALATQGTLAGKSKVYAEEAKKTGNTQLLNQFAKAAQEAGLKKEAHDAFQELVKLQPNNYNVLRDAGIAAFEEADYTSSKIYLGKYINGFRPETTHDPKAYTAYFFYAEVLRRDGDKETAQGYYRRTLALMANSPVTADNVNMKAQSQIWSGDIDAGTKTMDLALQQYPYNGDMKKEFVDTLIELKQYDRAKTLLDNSQARVNNAPQKFKTVTSTDLPVLTTPVRNYTVMTNNRELLITFARPVNASDVNKLRSLPWVNYTSDGYDTVLVATLPEYKFHIDSNKLHFATDEDSNETPVQKAPQESTGE